ncbi:MAG: DUF885 domain-containing protein [Chryseolinea sp.]
MRIFLMCSLVGLCLQILPAQEMKIKMDALTKNANKMKEKEKIDMLSEIYMSYQLEASPETGTFIGKPSDNSKWTDMSRTAIDQRKKNNELFLNAINSINRTDLTPEDQLNYDLLKSSFEIAKEGDQFPSELLPINQMSGTHQFINMVASVTSISNEKDMDNYLSRLRNISLLIDQNIALMEEGIKKKIVPPKATLRGVPEQIQNMLTSDASKSPLMKPAMGYIEKLPVNQQERYKKTVTDVIRNSVNPSFEKLKTYIEKTYIPSARETVGLSALPNGTNWYNFNIKQQTTTSQTYQQIHQTGLSEVKRIRKQMDSLILAVGFKGSFEEFGVFLKTDQRFIYATATELLDGYRVIAKKVDAQLPKYFGKLPRLTYGVEPVPSFDEKFQTTAYYMSGSTSAGRSGTFYANTYDLKTRPKWEMEALTIHEAVPGHHLQLALAEEQENVPEFRKYDGYTAFIEGWGLYSESLGVEMGFYKDPYSKFGQLTYEMWRAIRLVVDTGIHGMGWTRQQAIDYFKSNAAKNEHDIIVEIDRYIGWPGQALAYKTGELKIKELRAIAQKKLGDKFDLRKFHDVVLGSGSVPLSILEKQVYAWIDSVK